MADRLPAGWERAAGTGVPTPVLPKMPADSYNMLTRPLRDWFTLHFIERPIEPDGVAIVVELEINHADDTKAWVADLVLSVDEWDRIWRSLVDATGSFEKRGIGLARTHPPGRM